MFLKLSSTREKRFKNLPPEPSGRNATAQAHDQEASTRKETFWHFCNFSAMSVLIFHVCTVLIFSEY